MFCIIFSISVDTETIIHENFTVNEYVVEKSPKVEKEKCVDEERRKKKEMNELMKQGSFV